jgi:hypothetical protein
MTKDEFLMLLNQYARIPATFRRLITNYQFEPKELDQFAEQLKLKYKLKKVGRSRGA